MKDGLLITFRIISCYILMVASLTCCNKDDDYPDGYVGITAYPDPSGEVFIGADASEMVITLQDDRDCTVYCTVKNSHGQDIETQAEYYVINPSETRQGRWCSVDYTNEKIIKLTIEENETGYTRWVSLVFCPVGGDKVSIRQSPYLDEEHDKYSKGVTRFNVVFTNASNQTIALNNIVWNDCYRSNITDVVLKPSKSCKAYTVKSWLNVDLSDDAIPSSLWCEYLTPISCDVTYNDTHTCSYSYFEPREEKHYILDWTDYRIEGRLEPSIMPDGEAYIHNWTLTYTFTDADYEYAVANGDIR